MISKNDAQCSNFSLRNVFLMELGETFITVPIIEETSSQFPLLFMQTIL